MLKYPAIGLVWLYQKTLSPDHSLLRWLFPNGYCRYHPTCSNYMKEALWRYGFFRGVWRGARRVFRCNPFSKGGFDPVK